MSEPELEPLIGRTVARWRARLFAGSEQSARRDGVWLRPLREDEDLGELANGMWHGGPARFVPFEELTEWYTVRAVCQVDGRRLQVTGIDGDAIQVFLASRGPDAFTIRYGFVQSDWDSFQGVFDRSQVQDLHIDRVDHLAVRRARDLIEAVLPFDVQHLNRSWCRYRGKPMYQSPNTPGPKDDVVLLSTDPPVKVAIADLQEWTLPLLYAVYRGHPVLVDFVSGHGATISTVDGPTWADSHGMRSGPSHHPLYGNRFWWQRDVSIIELSDFRMSYRDLLEQWRDNLRS